jgi:hypothetical protein
MFEAAKQMLEAIPLQRADRAQIIESIRTVYNSALKIGRRIPNINETPDEVLHNLNLRGLTTEKSKIKKIAMQSEFANLREPRGVRHNNRGIPRRHRRTD